MVYKYGIPALQRFQSNLSRTIIYNTPWFVFTFSSSFILKNKEINRTVQLEVLRKP